MGSRFLGRSNYNPYGKTNKAALSKPKGQNNYQSYTPAQLQAFYTRKIYFASKLLPDSTSSERLFLECYLKGKYSLYSKGNKLYIEYNEEPLRQIRINGGVVSKDGIMVKRPDGEFLEFLQRLSSECPGLGLQIQANVQSYDIKSFLDLLEDYHNCLKTTFKRFGTAKESYHFQWEASAALGTAQMPLKSSFMGLRYYSLILHQGAGFSANGAMILTPQRFIFFPSVVVAPEWAQFTYSQDEVRYIDDATRKSTYVESHYRANFLAIPIYLRQPLTRLGKGFISVELGARLESILGFSAINYLIETEGSIDRQYPYVETAQFNYFTERARGFSAGILSGIRFSFGNESNANGAYAVGFRYSRVKKNDPKTDPFDQPILVRNSLYGIYFSKRL